MNKLADLIEKHAEELAHWKRWTTASRITWRWLRICR